MNLKNTMQNKSRLMIWRLALALLSILCMTSMVGLFPFNARAIAWNGAAVSPRSCSVGDTVTITISGGASVNVYKYGYRIAPDTTYTILTDWVSASTFEYIPTVSGTYYFIVYAEDGSTSSNAVLGPVTVDGSVESSAESSSESSAESSIPLPFLPSDWGGSAFVQPSAESTPTLDVSLPSDVQLSVPSGIGGVLSSAFQAFPAPLLALLIPTIICLFIGWWLHK